MQPIECVGHFAATGVFPHQGFDAQHFEHHPFWFFTGESGAQSREHHILIGASSKTLALLTCPPPAKIGQRRKHEEEDQENCRRGVPNLHGAQCRGRFTERKPQALRWKPPPVSQPEQLKRLMAVAAISRSVTAGADQAVGNSPPAATRSAKVIISRCGSSGEGSKPTFS